MVTVFKWNFQSKNTTNASNIEPFFFFSHNMDQTDTFMVEATEFFVEENLPRFLRGEEVLNQVDAAAGY
jgi:hypothetical protein